MILQLDKTTDKDTVNNLLRRRATEGHLQQQIDFVDNNEVCSSDFVGNRAACIVDAQNTKVVYVCFCP